MGGDKILVRAQEPQDMAEITEILNQPKVVWGTLQTPFTSLASRIKRFEGAPAGWTPLVAVIDGKVIGQAGINRQDGRRGHVGVIGMSVHDAFAGRGVGSALMAALVDLADRIASRLRLPRRRVCRRAGDGAAAA